MPKEFSEWLGAMAGTIEDHSIVDYFVGDDLTMLQKRMLIADLLVPFPKNELEVDDWATAFCMSLDNKAKGERQPCQMSLKTLIGSSNTQVYLNTEGDSHSLQWLRDIKKQIRHRTLKGD